MAPAQSNGGTYLDDNGLALQAAAAIKNDDRTQAQIAEIMGVTPGAISQAIDPQYGPGRIRKLRIRIVEGLLGYDVRGPVFHVTQPTDTPESTHE